LNIKIPVLKLPGFLRSELKTPLGKLLVSESYIKGLNIDYCVGDIVSENQNCEYRIIDYKTLRGVIKEVVKPTIVNPPGALSINTFTALLNKGVKKHIVDGEEDLIVLAIARRRDITIAYGQPRTGVVIYKSDPFRIVNIIKAFKPDIVNIDKRVLTPRDSYE